MGTVRIEPPAPSAPSDIPIRAPNPSASRANSGDTWSRPPLSVARQRGRVGQLLAQDVAHDVARVGDARVGEPVIDARAGATRSHQAGITHDVQVLGDVWIGHTER